jgi:hypothetical protein
MVTLPKNCKIVYFNDRVHVKATYATSVPIGNYDGINVFANYQGRRYFTLTFDVKYQHNMPYIVKDMYFKIKGEAMMFNRTKKVERLKKEMDLLSKSKFPGLWDLMVLDDINQFPPPPDEIYLPY